MKSMPTVSLVVLAILVVHLPRAALATAKPAAQCGASKLRATAMKASGKLRCGSKAVLRPETYASCASKVDRRFTGRFKNAEKHDCALNDDAGPIATKVDLFIDDVREDLTGAPAGSILITPEARRCAVAKLRAAARKSVIQLGCAAKTATTGATDPSCAANAAAGYDQQWDGAEGKGGCATTGDKAAIAMKSDGFVDAVVTAVPTAVLSDLVGTLFVTIQFENRLLAIDAASGDVLRSANTEVKPVGVETTGGKVYVANETSGTISVFDAGSLALLTVIPACGKPHHTALSPDGSRFYAACLATNKVAVVDTASDVLVGLLTSGAPSATTHQPRPTADGQRLWVANWQTDDITEIDLATTTILRTISLPARPVEVMVSPDAKTAYASVPELSKLMVYDLETSALAAELTMLAPENLTLSADGTTLLSSWPGLHVPTAVSIVDTATLTTVDVFLPAAAVSHNELTPNARFGFATVLVPHGVAVVDIDAAEVRAVHPIPGGGTPHGLRFAPGST